MGTCRHIIGLAGPPGAGKSTLAHEVVRRVNKLWPQKSCSMDSQVQPPEVAIVLPMDGFHLYRRQLDAMEVIVVSLTCYFYFLKLPLHTLLSTAMIDHHC